VKSTRAATVERHVAKAPSRVKRTDCLACRTLVAVARQRKGFDAARCQLVFEHLDTALSIQMTLHRRLAEHQLTELQFAVLVALFALDPEPAMPADLACYTAVSRAAITDALVRLEALHLVNRTRDENDRRIYHLRLTEHGRNVADTAVVRYLDTVGRLARDIDPEAPTRLLHAYARLREAATEMNS
jgi:DNA-binding MarR family transcriptional regulator